MHVEDEPSEPTNFHVCMQTFCWHSHETADYSKHRSRIRDDYTKGDQKRFEVETFIQVSFSVVSLKPREPSSINLAVEFLVS